MSLRSNGAPLMTAVSARPVTASVDQLLAVNQSLEVTPVQVKMPQGTINANHLEVSDSGSLISFLGGVTMVLVPQHAPAGAGARTP